MQTYNANEKKQGWSNSGRVCNILSNILKDTAFLRQGD